MTRGAKSVSMAAFSETSAEEMAEERAIFLRKKAAAGQSIRRQSPTPPPATPGNGANPAQP